MSELRNPQGQLARVAVTPLARSARKATPGFVTTILDRYFYSLMSLFIATVVAYGFSFTVGANLIHPPTPRPPILYAHATLFTGWLFFFIAQSALVRTGSVNIHRRLGWFGLGLAIAMVIVGFSTAVIMTRLHLAENLPGSAESMVLPFWDMLTFGPSFALAIYWRKKPEFHRRLIFIATCALTAASFGRFPSYILPDGWLYVGVDTLILFGVVRDLVLTRRVHPVYQYGLPVIMAGQALATYAYVTHPSWWMRIAHFLLG